MALWDPCLETVKNANGTEDKVATLQCVPIVLGNIINAALIFSGLVALIFIILSGIKLVTSGGDPKQVEGARKTMTWAIIGLVIIFTSFLIINVISHVTGVSCITTLGLGQCQ